MAPSENSINWKMIIPGQSSKLCRDEVGASLPCSSSQVLCLRDIDPKSNCLQKTSHSSDENDIDDEDETNSVNLRNTTWSRKVVPRPDVSRNDIYYYDDYCKGRLRSLTDVEKHCKRKNLRFKPKFFDFSGKNTYEGLLILNLWLMKFSVIQIPD